MSIKVGVILLSFLLFYSGYTIKGYLALSDGTESTEPETEAGNNYTIASSDNTSSKPTSSISSKSTATTTAKTTTPTATTTPTTTANTTTPTATTTPTTTAKTTTPTATSTTTLAISSTQTISVVETTNSQEQETTTYVQPTKKITSTPRTTTLITKKPKTPSSRATSPTTTTPMSVVINTTIAHNVSTTPTGASRAGKDHQVGTMLVLFLGVICAVVAVGLVILYIWQKRKRSYIPCCTWRSCHGWCDKRMRSSTTASDGPLTMEDPTSLDAQETRPERELFSIGDQDGGDDGRPRSRARLSTDDGYYYDEIFEKSAFVDETTNKSNKKLTIDNDVDDDDDELDIPDLVFKKPSNRY